MNEILLYLALLLSGIAFGSTHRIWRNEWLIQSLLRANSDLETDVKRLEKTNLELRLLLVRAWRHDEPA